VFILGDRSRKHLDFQLPNLRARLLSGSQSVERIQQRIDLETRFTRNEDLGNLDRLRIDGCNPRQCREPESNDFEH